MSCLIYHVSASYTRYLYCLILLTRCSNRYFLINPNFLLGFYTIKGYLRGGNNTITSNGHEIGVGVREVRGSLPRGTTMIFAFSWEIEGTVNNTWNGIWCRFIHPLMTNRITVTGDIIAFNCVVCISDQTATWKSIN